MYHGVGDSVSRGGELRYTVSEESFSRQVAILAAERRVISYPDLLAGRGGVGAAVVTFDDGEKSVITHALPVMRQAGLSGTVFMTTGWIGSEGYLDPEDLRALEQEGWTVGTHGVTHRYLSDLDDPSINDELVQSRDALTLILGHAPRHMSLPGGRADARVARAVRQAGYQSQATSVMGRADTPPNPFAVPRMMVLRHHGDDLFRLLAAGDQALLLKLRLRQGILDGAKRVMGNRGYDLLRGVAIRVLGRANKEQRTKNRE